MMRRRDQKAEKRDARAIQRYTGARYMTCLRWVLTLRNEGLIDAEVQGGKVDRDVALRVALHKRFEVVV